MHFDSTLSEYGRSIAVVVLACVAGAFVVVSVNPFDVWPAQHGQTGEALAHVALIGLVAVVTGFVAGLLGHRESLGPVVGVGMVFSVLAYFTLASNIVYHEDPVRAPAAFLSAFGGLVVAVGACFLTQYVRRRMGENA